MTKKIYIFSYEYDDENMCIGVVANTKKEALGLFDHDEIGYEGNNPMKDLDCTIHKDKNVEDIKVGVIDQIWGVKNNIYFNCEGDCENCKEWKNDLYELNGMALCSDCGG